MKDYSSSIMFAIEDTLEGHNIPDLFLGETPEGEKMFAKAVFRSESPAFAMANHMDTAAEAEGRFKVCMVEIWKPTDIELYVRQRIREHENVTGPKIQLLN